MDRSIAFDAEDKNFAQIKLLIRVTAADSDLNSVTLEFAFLSKSFWNGGFRVLTEFSNFYFDHTLLSNFIWDYRLTDFTKDDSLPIG